MIKDINILLIEDDTIEVMKFKRVLSKKNPNAQIVECYNGEQAVDYLKTAKVYPDIIVMDLNMPKMNGIEFLGMLKKDPELRYIPAIILTTSKNRNDMLRCYEIGIAGYFSKPLKYEDYETIIHHIHDYWAQSELYLRQ